MHHVRDDSSPERDGEPPFTRLVKVAYNALPFSLSTIYGAVSTSQPTPLRPPGQPHPWSPPPAVYHELRQRLSAREALVSMRQNARNQLHALRQWPVQVAAALQPLEHMVMELDKQIADLDQAIAGVLREGAWATSAELMQTITGIGPLTT